MLNGRHADLLFSVAWRGGGDAPVYLLFEHQSTSDARMAFRLLRLSAATLAELLTD